MFIIDVFYHAYEFMKRIVKKIAFFVCVWLLLEAA